MTPNAEQVLQLFDALPEAEKSPVAAEILRR